MTLAEFLSSSEMTVSTLAEKLGLTGKCRWKTVHRYLRGERIPAPPIMRRIYEVTDGQVTANDFIHFRSAASNMTKEAHS